jgi:hypothetical protein
MNSHPPLSAPGEPAHPLHALTTYELRDYRRDLEHSLNVLPVTAPARDLLQGKLAAVLAEQESRNRLRQADGH